MKKDRILNPALIQAIAQLGHTETIVIADAGLPIPPGIPVVDLSVVRGIPDFLTVLGAVCEELVVESAVIAQETPLQNPCLHQQMQTMLRGVDVQYISHEAFKQQVNRARAVVRTGECSPFANVILAGGVNF